MFPPATYEEWLKRAGVGGQQLDPNNQRILFDREIGPRAMRQEHGPWTILSILDGPDPAVANRELAGGANGFVLKHADSILALRDQPLHRITIRNESGDAGAELLIQMISQLPIDPARMNINFGLETVAPVRALAAAGYKGAFFEARALKFETADQELFQVTSQAVAMLRSLDFLTDMQITSAISIKLSIDQNMFQTMAKFRAMRILWARILELCKLPNMPLNLHGETARHLKQGDDQEYYMLRAVAAVFGAGLGGASSITVLPFKSSGEFERRMALNVQNILLHEAHLWRVSDPAAGAGYVEKLTSDLCTKAWNSFQAGERRA
jgi:methylmalonyl-CoA mutase